MNINTNKLSTVLLLISPAIFAFGCYALVTYNTHPICLFKNLTGYECWGCGMTRAFNALFHLKFKEAYNYNPRVYIASVIMLAVWIWLLRINIQRKEIINGKET